MKILKNIRKENRREKKNQIKCGSKTRVSYKIRRKMYITLTIILLICVGFGHVMVIVASSIRALTSQGEVVRRRDATQVNQRRGHSVQMYVPPYYIYICMVLVLHHYQSIIKWCAGTAVSRQDIPVDRS